MIIHLIKSIVDFFLNPLHIIVLLLLLSLFLYRKERFYWLKKIVFITISFFLITATYPIPDLLLKPLEKAYPVLREPTDILDPDAVDILVLGSGHTRDLRLPPLDQLSYTSLNRVGEGIRLHKMFPNSALIFSGYGKDSPISQAEVTAVAATSLGVEKGRIRKQSLPSNTKEEILTYRDSSPNSAHLILVTSAYHMPRAMLICRELGLDPIPAPTDFQVMHDPEEGFNYNFFGGRNFEKVRMALHEYVGMLYEKWF